MPSWPALRGRVVTCRRSEGVTCAAEDATGFQRQTVTGPDGRYRLGDLRTGSYTVTAEKNGFRRYVATGVVLAVNQKAQLDVRLELGELHESVTVVAEVSPLETGDASVGYRLDQSLIRRLPLDGRNVVSLVTLGPGTIPRQLGGFVHDVHTDIQEARGAVGLNPPVNGARSTMNTFLLDGGLDTDLNARAIAVIPPIESVREFRIQSSLPSAEFPQSGGAVVDLVTKSGSRKFHGSSFEYFRNEAVDARHFFDDPSLGRGVFRQNQFGGTLGGPLPFKRTFFFAAYEGLRGKSATPLLRIVPTAEQRAGVLPGVKDPLAGGTPFPGGVIPKNRVDSIASAFLAEFQPLPNRNATTSNFVDSTPTERTEDSGSIRVDHQRLFFRYTINDERNRLAGAFPELPTDERIRAQQAVAGYTSAGSRWVNEARFSFTRLQILELPENAFTRDVAAELGVSGPSREPVDFGLPFFLVTNVSLVSDTPNRPLTQRDNLYYFSDTASVQHGRHILKFGGQLTRFELNYQQSRVARGRYTFTGFFSSDPFGDFLLGIPQITERSVGDSLGNLQQNIYAAFVQDDWKLSPRVTLNLGIRYEYAAPFRETNGKLRNLVYGGGPPTLQQFERSAEPDQNNFAPRVGLAWRLAPETVFRTGYGVFFSSEIAVESYDLVRNGIRNEKNITNEPILSIADGFPKSATTGLSAFFGLDRDARTPMIQQWNAGFQRRLPTGIVAEVAYIGTKGTHLGRFRRFNTPLHAATGANLPPREGDRQAMRPWPQLGEIIQRQHIANSSYHSLQTKVDKRMSKRLALLASFVWSKSIDDADSVVVGLFDSVGAQDERNLQLERGLSFFNVGRRLSAGGVYSLPFGVTVSGIYTLQDGTPLNPVYFAFDGANSATPNRPDVVPGVSVRLPRSERTADRWFNTGAFREPAPFTFGNAGRNTIPGPGNQVVDLALAKRFALTESAAMELRAESFNLQNTPNLGIPGPYPDFGPFFGRIFSAGQPRRIQFVLRLDW